mmetsp:Transcript_29776/g.72554  ORF Transcript_29776/g.72554 Transcript_29776/m.72554 type:complete len:211 (+) Transcript_29776:1878-2510(+)
MSLPLPLLPPLFLLAAASPAATPSSCFSSFPPSSPAVPASTSTSTSTAEQTTRTAPARVSTIFRAISPARFSGQLLMKNTRRGRGGSELFPTTFFPNRLRTDDSRCDPLTVSRRDVSFVSFPPPSRGSTVCTRNEERRLERPTQLERNSPAAASATRYAPSSSSRRASRTFVAAKSASDISAHRHPPFPTGRKNYPRRTSTRWAEGGRKQ